MSLDWNESEYRDFLHYLMKAVEEEEVKKILRTICSNNNEPEEALVETDKEKIEMQQRIKELQAQNTILQEKLVIEQNKRKQEQEYTNQLEQQITKIDDRHSMMKKQVEEWQMKYTELSDCFEQGMKVFEYYQNLSPVLQSSLSGIFRGNTVERFLFCGVQKQNIELLWDAIKIRVIDENYEEFGELQSIFNYFFHAYNSTFEKPLYELQSVDENEKFDSEKHMRTAKSRVSGNITAIVFNGYINTNSKKIERKSIVLL